MNPIDTTKQAVSLVKDVIEIAGRNDDANAAARSLAKSSLTIAKTVELALLPLAAVNFGFERARDYFSTRFGADIADATSSIPERDVVEPKASVAGPALQGLAFSHDEPALKHLYLQLLARAMDSNTAAFVHPAFAEIIRQLTSDEALLLQQLLADERDVPIAELRINYASGGYGTFVRHLLNLPASAGFNDRRDHIPAMLENCARLALIELTYGAQLMGAGIYDWVTDSPEYLLCRTEVPKPMSVTVERGLLRPTAFGMRFGRIVGISESPAE